MAQKLPQPKVERIFELLAAKKADGTPLHPFCTIGHLVGCSEVTVRHYAAGRRKRTPGPSEENREKARKMWVENVPLEKICQKTHMSLWKLKDICADLPRRKQHPRLNENQKEKLRQMYADGEKVAVIAATLKCTEQTVRMHTKHLPRRIRRKTLEVNVQRCVIISTLDEETPYLVQPTGRMEFCSTGIAPERQWQIEVMDTRDARLKMIAMADILTWKQPLHGAPALVGIKLVKAS